MQILIMGEYALGLLVWNDSPESLEVRQYMPAERSNVIMVKKAIIISMAGAIVLVLNSCMMWMHGDMSGEHAGHQTGQGTTLVKEVQRGDLKLSAEIPPLWAGREAVLTVKIEELSGGRPASASFER